MPGPWGWAGLELHDVGFFPHLRGAPAGVILALAVASVVIVVMAAVVIAVMIAIVAAVMIAIMVAVVVAVVVAIMVAVVVAVMVVIVIAVMIPIMVTVVITIVVMIPIMVTVVITIVVMIAVIVIIAGPGGVDQVHRIEGGQGGQKTEIDDGGQQEHRDKEQGFLEHDRSSRYVDLDANVAFGVLQDKYIIKLRAFTVVRKKKMPVADASGQLDGVMV